MYIEIYAAKRICHCDATKGWGPVFCSPNSYEFAYALVCMYTLTCTILMYGLYYFLLIGRDIS